MGRHDEPKKPGFLDVLAIAAFGKKKSKMDKYDYDDEYDLDNDMCPNCDDDSCEDCQYELEIMQELHENDMLWDDITSSRAGYDSRIGSSSRGSSWRDEPSRRGGSSRSSYRTRAAARISTRMRTGEKHYLTPIKEESSRSRAKRGGYDSSRTATQSSRTGSRSRATKDNPYDTRAAVSRVPSHMDPPRPGAISRASSRQGNSRAGSSRAPSSRTGSVSRTGSRMESSRSGSTIRGDSRALVRAGSSARNQVPSSRGSERNPYREETRGSSRSQAPSSSRSQQKARAFDMSDDYALVRNMPGFEETGRGQGIHDDHSLVRNIPGMEAFIPPAPSRSGSSRHVESSGRGETRSIEKSGSKAQNNISRWESNVQRPSNPSYGMYNDDVRSQASTIWPGPRPDDGIDRESVVPGESVSSVGTKRSSRRK